MGKVFFAIDVIAAVILFLAGFGHNAAVIGAAQTQGITMEVLMAGAGGILLHAMGALNLARRFHVHDGWVVKGLCLYCNLLMLTWAVLFATYFGHDYPPQAIGTTVVMSILTLFSLATLIERRHPA